jgi:hypothetical protein
MTLLGDMLVFSLSVILTEFQIKSVMGFEIWQFFFLLPIPVSVIQTILILLVFPFNSLQYMIDTNNKQGVLILVNKIYLN